MIVEHVFPDTPDNSGIPYCIRCGIDPFAALDEPECGGGDDDVMPVRVLELEDA